MLPCLSPCTDVFRWHGTLELCCLPAVSHLVALCMCVFALMFFCRHGILELCCLPAVSQLVALCGDGSVVVSCCIKTGV